MKKLNIPKRDELERLSLRLKRKSVVELKKIAKIKKVGTSAIIRAIIEEYLCP